MANEITRPARLNMSWVRVNTSKPYKELKDIIINIQDELKRQEYYELKDLYESVIVKRKFDELQKAIGDIVSTKLGISDLNKQDILHIVYILTVAQLGYLKLTNDNDSTVLEEPPSDHFENFYSFLYPYQIEVCIDDPYDNKKYDYEVDRLVENEGYMKASVKGFETRDELINFFMDQIQDFKNKDIKYVRLYAYNRSWDYDILGGNSKYNEISIIKAGAKFMIDDYTVINFSRPHVSYEDTFERTMQVRAHAVIVPGNAFTLEPPHIIISADPFNYIFNGNKEDVRKFVENYIDASRRLLTLFTPKEIHLNDFEPEPIEGTPNIYSTSGIWEFRTVSYTDEDKKFRDLKCELEIGVDRETLREAEKKGDSYVRELFETSISPQAVMEKAVIENIKLIADKFQLNAHLPYDDDKNYVIKDEDEGQIQGPAV